MVHFADLFFVVDLLKSLVDNTACIASELLKA